MQAIVSHRTLADVGTALAGGGSGAPGRVEISRRGQSGGRKSVVAAIMSHGKMPIVKIRKLSG